ncbi:MAG: hypothetical protein A2341_01605 [Deltaproteobacteria bacterium RIFOXYB12_FULL_58_9]|nr:MAG: hypothetical protein A2341_01605 [Deltaproteobacteria bacterium RIFOXYB12_FULL_58_9]
MLTPILLSVCLVTQPQSPATRLAVKVAEAMGATVEKLAVDTDESVTTTEKEAAIGALTRTGLFRIVDNAEAVAALKLSRIDNNTMLAAATSSLGDRMWIGHVDWPAAADSTARDPEDDSFEETHKKLLIYHRERLRVVPIVRNIISPPFVDLASAQVLGTGLNNPSRWQLGYAGAVPISNAPSDWAIMRGTAEVIDETELAKLLGNEALVTQIEDARYWPQVGWMGGFGAGALAGITSGIILAREDDRDLEAVGISLLTVGVACGIIAALFPLAGPRHVLEPLEAERLTDQFNEGLRHRLALSAETVHDLD